MTTTKRPRIVYMGEEIDWDSIPDPGAVDLADYFKHVRLSAHAINEASKIIPVDVWKSVGLYKWLYRAGNQVFKTLPVDALEGKHGVVRYTFEYDANGPVLKSVKIG